MVAVLNELLPSVHDMVIVKSWFRIARYIYNYGVKVLENQQRLISLHEIEPGSPFIKHRRHTGHDLSSFLKEIVSTPASIKECVMNDLKVLASTDCTNRRYEYWSKKKANGSILVQVSHIPGLLDNTIKISGLKDFVIAKSIPSGGWCRLTPSHIRIFLFKNQLFYALPGNTNYDSTVFAQFAHGQFWNDTVSHLSHSMWIPVSRANNIRNAVQGSFPPIPPGFSIQQWIPDSPMPTPTISGLRVAAVDPGLNPFLMIWTPIECFRVGYHANKILRDWYATLNVYRTLMNDPTISPILLQKIKYKHDVFHKTVRMLIEIHLFSIATWMIQRYDVIMFPNYQNDAVENDCFNFNHSNFMKVIKNEAVKHGKHIYICDESFTSKTCTHCGFSNEELKRSKVFKCPQCGVVYDRDIGAARNIFLKNVHDTPKSTV